MNAVQKILLSSLALSILFGSVGFLYPETAFAKWECPASGIGFDSLVECDAACSTSLSLCVEVPDEQAPAPAPSPSSGPSESGQLKLYNPLGTIDSFAALAAAIFTAIVIIAIPLTVIFLIWAGVLFVTARGNETQLAKAKKVFFWSVIGAMVIVASWVIAVAINNSVQTL